MSSWTDEEIDLLAKLWAKGWTASQIARELGRVSRNSVIGKVHRLGLSGNNRELSDHDLNKAKRKALARAQQRSIKQARAANKAAKKPRRRGGKIPPPPMEISTNGTSLYERKPDQCCWPLETRDETTWRYCGAVVEGEGASYCQYHAMIMYRDEAKKTVEAA